MTGLIEQYILAHPASDLCALGYFGTAFASSLPDKCPRTLDDWWDWGRDLVHQLGNAKRETKP